MSELSKYQDQPIDVVVRQIYYSGGPIKERADSIVQLGINFLDDDVRVYARRLIDEADEACIPCESIDLFKAAFASEKVAVKAKSGRRPRKIADVPVVDAPIWELLGVKIVK